MPIDFDQIQWKQVAHASYHGSYETVFKAEYSNYFLYKNGKTFQIEKKGTNQTKWISKEEFIKQLTLI